MVSIMEWLLLWSNNFSQLVTIVEWSLYCSGQCNPVNSLLELSVL